MTLTFVTNVFSLPATGANFSRGGSSENCPALTDLAFTEPASMEPVSTQSASAQPAYQHNGNPISAEAFYAIACDPRRNVAVEACAGAGKTWMLVSRIVRALLDGVDPKDGQLKVQPHEILAITFTKRAASEMRERLYKWLAEFAAADADTLGQALAVRGFGSQKGLQPLSVQREKLSNLYQSILTSGRQVQIRTFHGWFAALLRSAPLAVMQQLELPPNYELLEDDAPAKTQVWRRFYAALTAMPECQADFEAVVFEHGRVQCQKALQVALDKRIEFTLADACGVVDASVLRFAEQFPEFCGLQAPEEFLTGSAAHLELMGAAAKALGRASAPTFAAKGVELETALTNGNMPAVFAALLTEKGTPRKFGEKIAGIDLVRRAQDLVLRVVAARHQFDAWQYQQRMARLTRLLIAEFGALKRGHGWVDMNDVERAARVMLGDPVLAGWVQQRLDARIRHLLIDEFQDTNPLQWQALLSWLGSYAGSGGGTAPSVFIVGDPKQSIYRFRRAEPQVFKAAQAFVRDGLQGELLSCDHTRRNATQIIATVNAAMGEARDADNYQGFRQHTTSSDELGLVCKLPPIPRDANGAGNAGNAGNASSASSASSVSSANQGDDVYGSTSSETAWRDSLTTPRELPEETLRTLEARQAAAWIAQQIACGRKPQDIMALSRKRAGLAPLQDELRALHIAAQIGEKTELIDCCEVQDIVALVDVLVSPQHDLSLARVLKSPLFGLADDALVQLALLQEAQQQAQQQSMQQGVQSTQPPAQPMPWFELLQKTELLRHDLRGLAAIFTRWKGWIDQLPPHDALQAIYGDGDVLARFAVAAPSAQREAVLANLRALLGVSLQLGGGRYATPYALVRALKAGGVQAPAAAVENAVRLLTIHGAKGLEAETVLLLDTDTQPRKLDTMGVLVDWPGESAAPVKFVFLASESHPPACAVETLAMETSERQREELNALYVALTRARHTLAISSIEPYRETERSWWARLSGLASGAADATHATDASDAKSSGVASEGHGHAGVPQAPVTESFYLKELPLTPVNQSPNAIQKEVPVLTVETAKNQIRHQNKIQRQGDDEDSASARLGKAMHRLLEWGDVSALGAKAAAREFGLTPDQGSEAADMAARILQGEGAWAWDHALLGWQGNEVGLMYHGEPLRLDRLVQRKDSGEWWVLDYKSAYAPQNDPDLVLQLHHYSDAVRAIYPDAVVKCAFLTGQGKLVALPDGGG